MVNEDHSQSLDPCAQDGPTPIPVRTHSNDESVKRKPGRPRAVPENMVPEVQSLHQQGLGYRAIARELWRKGVSADWSTIRRVLKSVPRDG
jgi:hypothetical protein